MTIGTYIYYNAPFVICQVSGHKKINCSINQHRKGENIMDNVTKFGERLLKLREDRNETQLDLANAIGITRQSLSRYETNERTPNIDIIYSVAKHYNVSTDYLLGLSQVQSLDNDIQIACKVTGLSDESIKNLKLIESNNERSMTNMIISSQFFLEFVDFITIYFNDLINKHFNKMQIEDYWDEINKFSDTECEDRLKLCDLRNKIQKEWEDLVEITYYGEFRLTKKFNSFLTHIDCIAEEIAEKKGRDSNAQHNSKEE